MYKPVLIFLLLFGCSTENEVAVVNPPVEPAVTNTDKEKPVLQVESKPAASKPAASKPSESQPVKPTKVGADDDELPSYFQSGDLPLPSTRTVSLKTKTGSVEVGVFAFDKKGMITIKSLVGGHDERVKSSVARLNKADSLSVQVPPPSGKRGKYGKLFKRSDKYFGAALREKAKRSHQLSFY